MKSIQNYLYLLVMYFAVVYLNVYVIGFDVVLKRMLI